MKIKTVKTKIIWLNRHGERREHSLGGIFSYHYALNWFRESILESQGILSLDEKRTTKLRLLGVENHLNLTEPKVLGLDKADNS